MRNRKQRRIVPARAFLYGLLCLLGGVLVVEAGLRAVYFQVKSGHKLAIVYGLRVAESRLLKTRQPVGIWAYDETLGYDHIPGAHGTHHGVWYRAEYTIDERKGRRIPCPEGPVGTVLFLGGSFTFGHGVSDRDAYPAVLAREFWKEWEVRNRAVMGWGTAQAWLALQEALAGADPPDLVAYGMIPDHIERNYIRASWVRAVTAGPYGKRGHPRVEIEGGKPVHRGLVEPGEGLPDSPEVRDRELRLTLALLTAMRGLCEERGAGFVVLLLPRGPIPVCWPPELIRGMERDGVPFLDLSGLPVNGIPYDGHLDAESHRAIAEAVAGSFVSDMLRDRAARPRP